MQSIWMATDTGRCCYFRIILPYITHLMEFYRHILYILHVLYVLLSTSHDYLIKQMDWTVGESGHVGYMRLICGVPFSRNGGTGRWFKFPNNKEKEKAYISSSSL